MIRTRIAPLFSFLLLAFALTDARIAEATATRTTGEATRFDYAALKGLARHTAEQPYRNHKNELPPSLLKLDWDEYQEIRFDPGAAIWRGEETLFQSQLFHLGLYFLHPIKIYEVIDNKSREIAYRPGLFDYGKSGVDAGKIPKDAGFAGFRLHHYTDWQRDIVAFLGASYFRAVGSEMQYGLSARGLAIDTALPRDEEFPIFTHFWLVKPKSGEQQMTAYALLDSPSVSGAYRFTVTPGNVLKMAVDVTLYPRKPIERLGIAPLTSMFMVGENDRRTGYDWRPEIHDSDGLALETGNGTRIWRPLTNPAQLRFNAYQDENPKGFGLLQRDRNFDHYQDDGVFYERRPSLWVVPRGNWGKGSVQLVEIPTLDETFDNIVAFWNPAKPIKKGEELLYSYDLYWGSNAQPRDKLAHVVDTFNGIGGVIGKQRKYYSSRFVVDFAGPIFASLGTDQPIEAVITTSTGRTEITSARPLHSVEGYRAMFDLVPPDNSDAPINIELHLKAGDRIISETWMYQWTPPPANQRQLHNAGHLK